MHLLLLQPPEGKHLEQMRTEADEGTMRKNGCEAFSQTNLQLQSWFGVKDTHASERHLKSAGRNRELSE